MMRERPTVASLRAGRGRTQLVNLFVETVEEATAADAAGIELMTLDGSTVTGEHRAAAPAAFMILGLEYGRLVTTDDYLRAAFAAMSMGGDAVWCAASFETIGRLAAEGVPVVSHVGLIPPKRTWTGGYRAVGKTAATALKVWDDVRRLEDAGAFGAEIEVVPEPVASAIAQRTSLFLISMGSGAGCDAQYLFAEDVLGTTVGHMPRHAKQYVDLASELAKIQHLRVDAFSAYAAEVRSGAFPDRGRLVPIDDSELAAFITAVDDDLGEAGNATRPGSRA